MNQVIRQHAVACLMILSSICACISGCEKVPTFQQLTGQEQSSSPGSQPNVTPPAASQGQPQPATIVEESKRAPIDPEKFLSEFINKPSETITEADLKVLSELESVRGQIQILNLSRTEITDQALQYVAKFSNLHQLDLSATTSLEGSGITALENCQNLRKLKISYASKMTPQGWEALSKLTQLEALDVSTNNQLSDMDVAHFASLMNVRELNLSETPITDEAFRALAQMQRLEILHITAATNLKGQGLQAYARSKPTLRELHASRTSIPSAGLRHLKTISSLEFLDVSACGLLDQQFAELRGANNITHLKIGKNIVTNAGLQIVLTMGKLKVLDLEGMQTVSDPGLGILSKKNGLQTLNLKGVSFTSQAIQAFQKIQKNCEVLTLP